jgi:hypothetical protein
VARPRRDERACRRPRRHELDTPLHVLRGGIELLLCGAGGRLHEDGLALVVEMGRALDTLGATLEVLLADQDPARRGEI